MNCWRRIGSHFAERMPRRYVIVQFTNAPILIALPMTTKSHSVGVRKSTLSMVPMIPDSCVLGQRRSIWRPTMGWIRAS